MKHVMMMAAALAAGAGAAGTAAANERGTVDVSVGYSQFSDDEVNLGALTGRVGYRFGPHFGVEGEGSFGVFDDELDVLGTDVSVSLNYAIGAFAVGYLPVGERFELFGRVGYGAAEVEAEALGQSESGDANGFAYGLGARFAVTERFGVRGEYVNYDGDDGSVDGFSVSASWRF